MNGMLCFLFKQKTAYEMRISDWSSDVCSSDLVEASAQLVDAGVDGGEELGHILGDSGNQRDRQRVDSLEALRRSLQRRGVDRRVGLADVQAGCRDVRRDRGRGGQRRVGGGGSLASCGDLASRRFVELRDGDPVRREDRKST